MSKSNYLEGARLELLFNGTAISNIADNAGTSPLTNLYVSLHTANPGEAGDQTTNEVSYTGYARVAVARSGSGWTVSGNSVSPAANIDFPECTGGSATATHFAIGEDETGGGNIFYYGALSSNISISTGVTPRLTTSTTITED